MIPFSPQTRQCGLRLIAILRKSIERTSQVKSASKSGVPTPVRILMASFASKTPNNPTIRWAKDYEADKILEGLEVK